MTSVAACSRRPRDRISLRLGRGHGVGMAGTPSPHVGPVGGSAPRPRLTSPTGLASSPPQLMAGGLVPHPVLCDRPPALALASGQGCFVSPALFGRVLRLGGIQFPEGPGRSRDAIAATPALARLGGRLDEAGSRSGSCSSPPHTRLVYGGPRALLAWWGCIRE